MIPILRIQILRPAMWTNFTQNWREHCNRKNTITNNFVKKGFIWKKKRKKNSLCMKTYRYTHAYHRLLSSAIKWVVDDSKIIARLAAPYKAPVGH